MATDQPRDNTPRRRRGRTLEVIRVYEPDDQRCIDALVLLMEWTLERKARAATAKAANDLAHVEGDAAD